MLKRQRVLAAREIRLRLAFLLIPAFNTSHLHSTLRFSVRRLLTRTNFLLPVFFFLSTRLLAIVHFPRRPSRRSSRFRYSVSLAFFFPPTSYYTSLLSLFRSLSFFGSILNSFAVPSKSSSPIFHQRPRICNFFLSLETSVGFCFALLYAHYATH